MTFAERGSVMKKAGQVINLPGQLPTEVGNGLYFVTFYALTCGSSLKVRERS